MLRTLSLAALSAVLLLSACSSGSDESPAGGGSTDKVDALARTEEFGMTEEELATSIEQVEAAIASCMSQAGFEYIPVDVKSFRDAMAALGTVPGLSDEDFVAQYGYGITTLFDNPGRATVFGEQNIRIYGQLSPADRVAYDRALLGEDSAATFVVTLDAENFSSTGGCTGDAVEQVFTPEQRDPSFRGSVAQQIAQHPRMVAAQGKWAECMREDGFAYARQEDAEADLADRLFAITGGADPKTLTGSALDALTQLQGEERAIAAKDFDCSEQFLDQVEAEVEFEITGRPPS